MENIRVLKILLPLAAMVFFVSLPIKAYSPNTTHHGLTAEVIKFFEYYHLDKKFSEDEKKWLKNGSVDEDHDIRPMNHFYDPIYNRGLWGFMSSKKWSQDTLAQANRDAGFLANAGNLTQELFSSDTDYSWDRAVYEYVYGDKKRALEALGHNLHLIEDATVPDHTRNDPHPPYFDDVFSQGSPYEGWTEQFNESNMVVAGDLIKTNTLPVYYPNLNEYFDKVANFSNNNFFSKDSTKDYHLPIINKSEFIRLSDGVDYEFGMINSEYLLARVRRTFDKDSGEMVQELFVKDIDNLVISDYWSVLSKEAVKNGAGVVKLFFDEVEKEKQTMALYEKNKSLLTRAKEKIGSVFSLGTGDGTNNIASPSGALFATDSAGDMEIDLEEENLPDENEIINAPIETEEEEDITEIPEISAPNITVQAPTTNNQTPNTPNTPAPGFGGGSPYSPSLPSSSNTASDEDMEDAPIPESIHISLTDPIDFSQTFTSASITFFGTSTPNALISNSYSPATTTADAAGDWQMNVDFEAGTNNISFTASLNSQTDSTATFEIVVDSIAPDIDFEIAECQNSIVDSECVLMEESEINLSWGADDDAITEFTLDLNGDIETISATSTIFSINDDGVYEFSITASDSAGNETTVSKTVEKISSPVVINEIAWAGTADNSSDEWMELYNRSNKTISLSGWILTSADGAPEIELSGSIAPSSFFILERTDDNTISDISADLIYSGALGNSGEEMLLKIGDYVVDKTPEIGSAGCSGWCAGQNITGGDIKRNSMERLDPDVSGSDINNWGTAIGEFILNGKDASGFNILGTPKSANSASRLITQIGILNTEKTLTKKFSPYLVGRTGFTISSGGILTVEPGVVIKIVEPNEPNFMIDTGGQLIASGTDSEKVVITSFADNEYGSEIGKGECSESAPENCPFAGSWGRVIADSSATIDLTHTIIRYGGRWFNGTPDSRRTMISADGATVNFESVVVEKSKKHGLYLFGGSVADISNSIFKEMNVDLDSVALYLDDVLPTLVNPVFENNSIDIKYLGVGDLVCDGCSVDLITDPVDLLE